MITNKNMSNIDLVEKLVERTIILSNKNFNSRELDRYINLKYDILSRMEKIEEVEEVMTKEHPLWNKFCNMLDFRLTYAPCDAETLTQSEDILKRYFPDINVEKSLEYFRNHGGFCDCEVLMNVEDSSDNMKI